MTSGTVIRSVIRP